MVAFCGCGLGGVLEATRAGASACEGGKKDDFWAVCQATVAAKVTDNAAESMSAGYELDESLIFSETY